jgi:hypothetical protein
MIKTNDDDEPLFRIRYVNKDGYWEQYDRMKKSWFRICDECVEKVCKSSNNLCKLHYTQRKKIKKKPKRLNTNIKKKKSKRLNTNIKRKITKRKTIIDDKV